MTGLGISLALIAHDYGLHNSASTQVSCFDPAADPSSLCSIKARAPGPRIPIVAVRVRSLHMVSLISLDIVHTSVDGLGSATLSCSINEGMLRFVATCSASSTPALIAISTLGLSCRVPQSPTPECQWTGLQIFPLTLFVGFFRVQLRQMPCPNHPRSSERAVLSVS